MAETKTDLNLRLWGRGLHHASDILIRRGTAMGSLIPLLLLSPIFLVATWFFRDIPVIAFPCFLVAAVIPFEYGRQFSRFAKNDPDRLQSEEYRSEIKQLEIIAAKELPFPVSANALHLDPPTSNPTQPQPELLYGADQTDETPEPIK